MKSCVTLLPLVLFSFSALAQSGMAGPADPMRAHADDPYYPYATLPAGKHAGDAIPVEHRRSIQVLHRDADETVTVAGFAHNDSFYLAKIPLNGLEKVYLQIDYFTSSVPAAHTEIRLRFREDSPIILYPQLLSEKSKGAVAIREAVFSIEAVKDESTAISFMKGFGKNYAVAYRFISMKQKRRDLVEIDKERVTQYELKLDPAQRKSVLTHAIDVSDRMGVRYFYNTWKRNCTTELIRLIDDAIEMPAWRRVFRGVAYFGAHYPVFVRSSFRARALLGEEIAELASDPTIDTSEISRPGVVLE